MGVDQGKPSTALAQEQWLLNTTPVAAFFFSFFFFIRWASTHNKHEAHGRRGFCSEFIGFGCKPRSFQTGNDIRLPGYISAETFRLGEKLGTRWTDSFVSVSEEEEKFPAATNV